VLFNCVILHLLLLLLHCLHCTVIQLFGFIAASVRNKLIHSSAQRNSVKQFRTAEHQREWRCVRWSVRSK